jgi:hypothetical protein
MSLGQLQRKHLTFLVVLTGVISTGIGAATLFSDRLTTARALQQSNERLVHRLSVEQGAPIVITSMKVNGQSISFDEKFDAPDDWLRGLVISVKNRSDKMILLVSLSFQFPRSPGSSERFSVAEMLYGDEDFRTRKPTSEERLVGVAPGHTVDIKLTSKQFEFWQSFLSETGYPSSIKTVNFRFNDVLFEDDTMWNGGELLKRDPKNLGTWVVQPSGLSKTRLLHFPTSTKASAGTDMARRFQNPLINEIWSPRDRASSRVQRAFSHATSTGASSPQNTCWKSSGTIHLSCEVPGHTCTFDKDTLDTSEYGGFYIADCSAPCSSNCGWHNSQIKNPCSPECDPTAESFMWRNDWNGVEWRHLYVRIS